MNKPYSLVLFNLLIQAVILLLNIVPATATIQLIEFDQVQRPPINFNSKCVRNEIFSDSLHSKIQPISSIHAISRNVILFYHCVRVRELGFVWELAI